MLSMIKRLIHINNRFRKLRFLYQKIRYGYSDKDLWNLDFTIAKFVLPRLKAFRKNNYSYPGCFENHDQWKKVLDDMIFSMECASKCDGYLNLNKTQYKRLTKGFRAFGKYFDALWT